MIHYVKGRGYVISSGGAWLPGCYANRRAAQWAFQFSTEQLRDLAKREPRITTAHLRPLKQPRPSA